MSLLLIEDDAMIGAGVQRALRQDGFATDWVRDGVAAALAVLDNPYDLLLLDLGLPRRDGIELLQRLRAAGNALPVLVLTARDAVADRIRGLDAGADDYVVKPFQQWDAPYNLYHRPANRFVADFVGEGVFLPGKVLGPCQVGIELGVLDGQVPKECIAGCPRGCAVHVLLRLDDIVHDHANAMEAVVVAKAFRGADFLYTLQLASGDRVLSLVPSHHDHAVGETIGVRLDTEHVVAFHDESGADGNGM